MEYVRSKTAIIDAPLVNIEVSNHPEHHDARLRLNYQGQRYDLIQAFASHKLELAQQRWQQQIEANTTVPCRYLLVREVGYYSLWVLDQIANPSSTSTESDRNLGLQQASIWLFQELWVQWQELLGQRQLQIFADNLLVANSHLKSKQDLDQLLSFDPLASEQLNWSRSDFIEFDRQLCDLTQKKMGQQFGQKLTIDIIESMPDSLRIILIDVLDLKTK
ncbi:MAG: hypothetical protein LH474_13125 [Chamaesiphon sp.]|nr:hypothetical protein [Chamaesiphon sp.]